MSVQELVRLVHLSIDVVKSSDDCYYAKPQDLQYGDKRMRIPSQDEYPAVRHIRSS